MLNWFYKWRLWGYSFVCEVLPQSHRDKPCAQSARRQRPCCRHLRRCISPSKMNVPLTQVALVARPCAPAAQLTDDSSSSSRRLAISLCPLRVHLILSKTAPSVCILQNENASMKSFGQIDSSKIKKHLPKLRSDSFQNFATASQMLGFEKAVFAPNWFFPADATRRHADFQNCGGSARSGLKSLIQNKQIQNYTL